VAEVLRENQVGGEFFEQIAIDGVDGFAAFTCSRTRRSVSAEWLLSGGVKRRRGFRFRAEGEIAFVADATILHPAKSE